MILLRSVFAILIISLASGSLCFAAESFRFAFVCDSRSSMHSERCTDLNSGVSPVLGVMVKDILRRNGQKPIGLFLFPGDMIGGYLRRDAASVSECNRIQLNRWVETIQPLRDAGMMVRVTAGNHEVGSIAEHKPAQRCGRHNWPYTPVKENFQVFRAVLGGMLPKEPDLCRDEGLTYSFDAGGCHFVMLNSYTMSQENGFSPETMCWLEEDLAKASERGVPIFVVSHPPAFPGGGHLWNSLPFYDPSYNCDGYTGIDRRNERDDFWNLLKKYKVAAYLCGHEHNTQVQEVEGVWHVIAGGVTPEVYPLNGAPDDKKKRNRILYDGEFQNPRASVIWPWDNGPKSYWAWCLFTVSAGRITLDLYGTDRNPCPGVSDKPCEEHPMEHLKKFVLKESSEG